ncbi:CHAT domain-containing protein [Nostoc sp. FACHB-892]|uniref:CHAT domain-containing protein n=1 Tax=Nostoc sp. FACHB-892 TaxID=2692843 RepID=UPI001681C474|nr:CHAT domain-containing protein [Nostoc sp. FACHB-892]MBD2730407.1 CHAT domain-containing protein [Nostoc sp. FACHB-892]
MIKRRIWIKYLFLSILGLSTVESKAFLSPVYATNKKLQKHNQAQLLIQRGKKYLDEGRAAEALQDWESATKLYRQIHYEEGVTGSLINQNLALQALGLNRRACSTLLQALKLNADADICAIPSEQSTESTTKLLTAAIEQQKLMPLNLLAWHNLGDVLRTIGKLDESKIVLEKIFFTARQVSSTDTSGVMLSLGNTEQAIYQQARNKYYEVEEPTFKKEIVILIQQEALKSIDIYQQVQNTPRIPQMTQLLAQLHQLSLLLDFEKWLIAESRAGNTKLANTHTKITQQIQPCVNLVLKNSSAFSQLSASHSVYTKLNFALNLNQLPGNQLHLVALEYAESALQTAKSTNNERLKSYSFGALGRLKAGQSEKYFTEASSLAQSIHAWDIAYQWQQELGNLYKKQGKFKQALEAYSAAINNLSKLRDSLLASNADLQFSFSEKVEPVYRDYMRLLLASPNPNLEQVIQTNERLQIAELENYLKCGKLDLVALNELQNLPSAPAVIHIVDLGSRIEILVQSPDKSLHHHSVDSKTVKEHIENLLKNLQDKKLVNTDESVLLQPSQALYSLLIVPIKKYLPLSGTLVFTLDKSFQSLPMALLHDGKDYLFQNYSIAVTLGSRVRQPKALSKEQFKVLIAALSKVSPSFNDPNAPKDLKALPGVEQEVADIKKQTTFSTTLLNENFTSPRLEKELSTVNFPIVHLTTHAQFSSDPHRTVILAYEKAINVLKFDRLLRNKTQADVDGIELLVLSACQTAKGNKRSTLGIAGVAAQAGARSTLATLWLVDTDSTTQLMSEFYKELRKGVPKAEALRQAQLSLLSNPDYTHPYYWAAFVLVGSWL